MPPKVSQVTKHHAIYKYGEHCYELEFHALEFSTLNGGEWWASQVTWSLWIQLLSMQQIGSWVTCKAIVPILSWCNRDKILHFYFLSFSILCVLMHTTVEAPFLMQMLIIL